MAAAVVAGALLLHPARTPPGAWAAGPRTDAFSVVEATIPDMRNALQQGRVTSRELVTQYLTRIATYEDLLNAVITVNPHALAEAEARDRDRAQGRIAMISAGAAGRLVRSWRLGERAQDGRLACPARHASDGANARPPV